MEIGQILAILLVIGYIILYIRGRYYNRENFVNMPCNAKSRVDVIGSGNY
jgi:hypothetical protein